MRSWLDPAVALADVERLELEKPHPLETLLGMTLETRLA